MLIRSLNLLKSALPAMAFLLVIEDYQANAQAISLEEIVVTARKRDENIQDIPISITAFSASDLARKNLQEMTDISLFTPGFNFENFGGYGSTAPVIRGATQVAATGRAQQNVSFFLDGVYLPRSYITDMGFADMERIEVVKGPQSARYGRNAFMGAINYVSRKPSEEWEIDASFTAGNFSRYDGYIAAGGAIVPEKLKVRAFYDQSKFDGSWKNSHPFSDIDFDGPGTDDRLGGFDKKTYGVSFQFTPTESLTIDASYRNYDVDKEHQAQNWFGELDAESNLLNCGADNAVVRPPGTPGFGGGGNWSRLFCGEIPVRSIPIDPRGYAQQMESDIFRASVKYDINDNISFEYIFGHIEADQKVFGFKDSTPPGTAGCSFIAPIWCIFESGPIGSFTAESHEARVDYQGDGNIDVSAGVYFFSSDDFITQNFGAVPLLNAIPTAPFDVLTSPFIFKVEIGNLASKQKAVSPFGEVTIRFMDDRARLGIEARYSSLKLKEDNQASGGGAGGLNAFAGAFLQDTYSSFTPRVSLEYDLSDASLLYASAAKGVKAGGFNAFATLAKNNTYDNDTNWTYEIGSKNTFADGRLQLNAALFLIEWSDAHILAQDEGNPAPLSRSLVRNVGDITSKGFELDTALALTDNISLYGTVYYGDAKYKDGTFDLRWGRVPTVCDNVVCNTNGDVGGNQMERQSKFQASLGGQITGELPGDTDLGYYLRADVGHQSKMYAEAINQATIGDRTVVNSSLGLLGDNYEIQWWVRNLFDAKYVQNVAVQQPNIAYNAYLGERLTTGVTLSINY